MTKREVQDILYQKDRLSYVDMISLLSMDGSIVHHCSEKGVVVTLPDQGLSSVACFSSWRDMLDHLDPSARVVCVHDEALRDHMLKDGSWGNEEGCWSFSWWRGQIDTPECDSRILDASFIGSIEPFYSLAGHEEILDDLSSGRVTGLFVDGLMVGFIGFHPEGSMGMLHVYEEYRKHGYGEILEKLDIKRAIGMGRIPYCHVFFSNRASFRLQEKIGLERGEKPVWWIWKEEE